MQRRLGGGLICWVEDDGARVTVCEGKGSRLESDLAAGKDEDVLYTDMAATSSRRSKLPPFGV